MKRSKLMTIEQIIEENTGVEVKTMAYKDDEIECYIAIMADGRTYYANSEWAGFVTEPIDELIKEIEDALEIQAEEEYEDE